MITFLVIGCVGFFVMVLSLIFGEVADHAIEIGHDISMDHDVHGDINHPHGGPGIFSIRIVSAFATGFGGFGFLSMSLKWGEVFFSSLCGLGAGFVMGALVYAFAAFVYKQQASSGYGLNDLIGKTASVITAISANGAGQVSLEARGATVTHFAVSEDQTPIPNGTMVVVKQVSGDRLIVARQ